MITESQDDKKIVKSRRRGIYLLPNLFTVSALFAGFYAIVAATQQNFNLAAIAIFVAMLLDSLDGRIARMTDSQSEFGAQLDSLSDMVCFGVSPALVLYSWSLSGLGKPGWLAAFIYTVCTALRLARFNAQSQNSEKRYFLGLATPPAAGLVAGLVWAASAHDWDGQYLSIGVMVLSIGLGLLKVSTIRYRSFKDIDMRGRVPFLAIFGMVLLIVLISIDPPDVLLAMFGLYVLSGPVMWLGRFWRKRFGKRTS